MSLGREELFAFVSEQIELGQNETALEKDSIIIEYLLDNCEIKIPQENRFFGVINCEELQTYVSGKRAEQYIECLKTEGLLEGDEALAYSGRYDFSHTTAEWESVISLGIYGLRERAREYQRVCPSDEKKQSFYRETIRVYDAALRFIERAAENAQSRGKTEMANGLFKLAKGRPSNLFEAMQTTIIYYNLQHNVEGTYLRTMGRLDSLFYRYFEKESDERGRRLLSDYISEIDRLKAPSNIPFMIGGSDAKGDSLVNPLTYLLLDTYVSLKPSNTKLHLLCSDDTPDDLLRKGLEAVRCGCNSIVFMSDTKIVESLEKLGETHSDAVNYHVVGCYECGGSGELTCSCNARVNLPKALELTLCGGYDMLSGKQIGCKSGSGFNSFAEFYSAFKKQLTYLTHCAMRETDIFEEQYRRIHSAPVLSSTYSSALEKGGDLYGGYTAKYNNSSLNAIGLGTLTDSLYAIKKLVFEDKLMTLDELVSVLRSDWKGNEPLRLHIKNNLPKFGMGKREVDCIAGDVVNVLSSIVNNAPNKKGGVYRLGLFSINWRWELGEKTAASADGRHSGETLSQNMSATFGADKNGATAHLLSAASIDASNVANGAIVDIDLHISAVSGENGLNALVSALKTYFELGGFGVHYNVLDTEVLKDAMLYPDKYPNLQVRLCGWNVLFSSLSDKEKQEFIERSVR